MKRHRQRHTDHDGQRSPVSRCQARWSRTSSCRVVRRGRRRRTRRGRPAERAASVSESLNARRMPCMSAQDVVEIVVHDVALTNDKSPVDDRVPRRHRSAAQPGFDRVGAAHPQTPGQSSRQTAMSADGAGLDHTDLAAATEAAGAARRRTFQAPCAPCPTRRRRAAWRAASPDAPPSTARRCRPTTSRRRRGRRARRRRATAPPERCPTTRIRLLLGQWATPTPAAPSRTISSAFGHHAMGDPRAIGAPAGALEVLHRAAAELASEKASSSAFSAKWVCRRTSSRSASSAERTISSSVTLNGLHGASAMRTIAPCDAVVMAGDGLPRMRRGSRRRRRPRRRAAARRPSRSATSSRGSDGSACPRSVAAAISADSRSPAPCGCR